MGESKTILSAAANGSVREQISDALNTIGEYSIKWVESSADLLITILDSDIDLVIIDEDLGDIRSSKLIKIIKKSTPKIPLILISSGQSKDELAKTLEEGVFYFLMTPVRPQELRQAVASAFKAQV